MKQEQGRLRVTAKREEIYGAHSEGVFAIVPVRDIDEMYGCFAEDQSVNSTSKVLGSILMSVSFVEQKKVIEVEILRHQQNIFPGTRKKLIYI